MISDLKPYSEYKSSNSPWMGLIPSHWKTPRLGSILRERREDNHLGRETQVLSVMKDIGVIRYEDKGRVGNKKSDDIRRYKIVRPDDIVVNCMNVIIGSVGRSRYTGCLSPVYYVLTRRAPTDEPKYLGAVFATRPFHQSLVRIGNGILAHRMRIPMELLKCELIPIPPPDEQTAIVRFLHWINGRLDRAIRSKKKVIALLNEQKQAIVHGRVYRGLDSSAALKPSGISWLGDIPQHWETPLFGRLLRGIEQGWSPIGAEGEITEKQWAVLTLSSVRRGSFNPLAIKPVSLKAAIPSGIEVHNGDILLTRSNTRDRVGDACVVREVRYRTILCDLIYRLRTREDVIDSNFLVYELLSRIGRDQIEQDARGSSGTMPKISQRHIKSWRIVLPPLDEQRKIVQQIESESAHFNIAISRLEREIDLLREYHTRLVTDLVSGKLDVRRAAAALPDEDLEADNVVEEKLIETDEGDEEFAEEGLVS